MQTAVTKKVELDTKLIIPFLNSVKSVLATMAGVATTIERPRFKTDSEPEADFSGIVAFSGGVVGTVVVTFKRDAAIKLVAAFAGGEIDPATPDFLDAIGELANMIAGAAKKDLGVAASISTPSVIAGKGHLVSRPRDIPCLVIPCKTALGDLTVEVGLKVVPNFSEGACK